MLRLGKGNHMILQLVPGREKKIDFTAVDGDDAGDMGAPGHGRARVSTPWSACPAGAPSGVGDNLGGRAASLFTLGLNQWLNKVHHCFNQR